MLHPTPFFGAFQRLLLGKPRLSEIEKLLRENETPPSLSQDEKTFGEFVPKAWLAREKSGRNSRTRVFPPIVTFWAFLAQVLERGSSCRDALRRIIAWWQCEFPNAVQPAVETGGYCQARARLPQLVLTRIGDHAAQRLESQVPDAERWQGRSVKILDGTTASMPDTAANQKAWPQPRSQQPGCGFPLVKLVGLFSMGSGALLHWAEGDIHQHESVLARRLWSELKAGDVLLADRGFCSFQALAEIAAQGADAVLRLHQARRADFRQGRRLGPDERLLIWHKPARRPPGCTEEAFAALPTTLTLRMVRYHIETPGFRTKEVLLITTLLDPATDPLQALAELYFQRWQIELHFREIKTLLGLDVLRCLTPEMVRKEIALHRIAYNLVRLLMQRAALTYQVRLARLSFKGTLDSLHHFADALHSLTGRPRRQRQLLDDLLLAIARDELPERPGRVEPRAKKRRPKNYHLLTRPRHTMRVPPHRNRPPNSSNDGLN
jgi:Transposase DDE domain